MCHAVNRSWTCGAADGELRTWVFSMEEAESAQVLKSASSPPHPILRWAIHLLQKKGHSRRTLSECIGIAASRNVSNKKSLERMCTVFVATTKHDVFIAKMRPNMAVNI